MGFKVGDLVEWTSAANGSWKTKRGTITKVSTGYTRSYKEIQDVEVIVPPAPLWNGKPSTAKPKIYYPRVSALKLVS